MSTTYEGRTRRKLTQASVCALLSLLALVTLEFLMHPGAKALNEKHDPITEVIHESQDSSNQQLRAVNLVTAPEISATASEAYESGRFRVETVLPEGSAAFPVFQQLFLRGGLVVAQDIGGDFNLLSPDRSRKPLDQASLPNYSEYALQRPRLLSGDAIHLLKASYSVLPSDRVLLVMPSVFEMQILSDLETILPVPLQNYRSARLSLEVSRGGHLQFTVLELEKAGGELQPMNVTLRGI